MIEAWGKCIDFAARTQFSFGCTVSRIGNTMAQPLSKNSITASFTIFLRNEYLSYVALDELPFLVHHIFELKLIKN